MTTRRLALLAIGLALVGGELAEAKGRLFNRLDLRAGLDVALIFCIAQDSNGFIWIGAPGALYRYDGDRVRRWTRDELREDGTVQRFHGEVWEVAAGLSGEVVFLNDDGAVYAANADTEGYRPVLGSDRNPISDAVDVSFDSRGRLWVVFESSVEIRDVAGEWRSVEVGTHRWRNLTPDSDGSMWFATTTAVWRSGSDGGLEKIYAAPFRAVALLPVGPESFIVALHDGEVLEVREGVARTILHMRARAVDLVKRGGTVWASFDRFLVALRGEDEPEVIGPTDTGPLMIDRDGALWMGSFTGVVQYPEPETVIWTHDDGLPSAHTNFLESSGGGESIWVATWQGLGRIEHTTEGWRASAQPPGYSFRICFDRVGRLWGAKAGRVWSRRGDRITTHPGDRGAPYTLYGCARSPSARGGLWLTTPAALLHVSHDAREPVLLNGPLAHDEPHERVFEDTRGQLWLTSGGKICRAPAQDVLDRRAHWSCQSVENVQDFQDLAELPSGRLLAATVGGGLLHWQDGEWAEHAINQKLRSQRVFGVEPSQLGGAWVLGHGVVERIQETPAGDVSVVESLASWHGLPIRDAHDILEEDDGDLWITTAAGVIQMPASARFSEMNPPSMRLVDVRVDGASQPLEGLRIPYTSQFVTIQFAAFSYRDRSLLRYRVRLRGDMPWNEFTGEPVLRIPRPDPGGYAAELQASLNGEDWSSLGARIEFRVTAPWYRRGDILTLLGVMVGALALLLHRALVTRHVELEKVQARAREETRMRIARDLHDQLAADIASVGLRASTAVGRAASHSDREQFQEIEARVGELGASISEIVRMLSPRPVSLNAFADELLATGRTLFVQDRPRFVPELSTRSCFDQLSPAQHSALLFIAKEGLRNAIRHAGADSVTLRLTPLEYQWRLSIQDDGHGSSPRGDDGGGRGLANMRSRAKEIGAAIRWQRLSDSGTLVEVDFIPAGDPGPRSECDTVA